MTIVTAAELTHTVSSGPGRTPVLQFDGVPQDPRLRPTQVTVQPVDGGGVGVTVAVGLGVGVAVVVAVGVAVLVGVGVLLASPVAVGVGVAVLVMVGVRLALAVVRTAANTVKWVVFALTVFAV
jgi:hypothetical protein